MDDVLATLATQIEAAVGLSVAIGHPDLAKAQLVLWPWHIASVKAMRNNTPRFERMPPPLPMTLSFLLLAEGRLKDLLRASRCISEHSVLTLDDARYMVKDQDLTHELQIALLHAAAIRPQPVMSYVLLGPTD